MRSGSRVFVAARLLRISLTASVFSVDSTDTAFGPKEWGAAGKIGEESPKSNLSCMAGRTSSAHTVENEFVAEAAEAAREFQF
jgi:hypothetical protein